MPARIFNAVLFPIPLVPTRPSTCPGLGVGRRCNLKELAVYRCVTSFARFVGRLMIAIASNGHLEIESAHRTPCEARNVSTHFLTQIPQPIHRNSDMNAILSVGFTSIHSLPTAQVSPSRAQQLALDRYSPILTTGHD